MKHCHTFRTEAPISIWLAALGCSVYCAHWSHGLQCRHLRQCITLTQCLPCFQQVVMFFSKSVNDSPCLLMREANPYFVQSGVRLSKKNTYDMNDWHQLVNLMYTNVPWILTWELTWPAFKSKEITVCTVDMCLLRDLRSTAPAIHTAGIQLGVMLSFLRCHSLSPAAANNIRSVGARVSHSEIMPLQLNTDSSDLLRFLRTEGGSVVLTNDTHSFRTKLPTSLNIAFENCGCFNTALQNASYLFLARFLPIGSHDSSSVAVKGFV